MESEDFLNNVNKAVNDELKRLKSIKLDLGTQVKENMKTIRNDETFWNELEVIRTSVSVLPNVRAVIRELVMSEIKFPRLFVTVYYPRGTKLPSEYEFLSQLNNCQMSRFKELYSIQIWIKIKYELGPEARPRSD